MRGIFLTLTLIGFLLFGCMKAKVAYTPAGSAIDYSRATVSILPHYLDDEPLAGCLQRFLLEDLPELKFFPEETFRDAMFPWFEYSTAPGDAAALSKLLEKPLVRSQIEKLGVEVLIYVHGKTIQDKMDGPGFCGGGYGGGGCIGYVSADRETYIATSVFDLKQAAALSSTDVRYKGTVRVPMLLIPIPIPVFTESSACRETARRVSDCLKTKAGRGPLETEEPGSFRK